VVRGSHGVFSLMLLATTALVASPALAQNDPGSTVQEVIVTAGRRSERLHETPMSVTVQTAEQLAAKGVLSTRDLTSAVPGLNFSMKGGFAQPVLRGVTSQGTGAGLESAVAIYVDGVYQANTLSSVFDMPDVAQVEVLKGPQGTLYGRNATAGAILLTTRRPSFTPTGDIRVGYGRYDEQVYSAFMSGPLVQDKVAASITAYAHKMDGYTKDLLRGGRIGTIDAKTVRVKLLFTPTDKSEFVLSGMTGSHEDTSPYAAQVPFGGNSASRRVAPQIPVTTEPFTNKANVFPILYSVQQAVSVGGKLDLGAGTLTSITAYSKNKGSVLQDADAGPAQALSFGLIAPTDSYSEELTFASRQFGRFRLISGLLLFRQTAHGFLNVNFGAQNIIANLKTDAAAGYVEATFDVTDQFSVTGGARYSWEEREYAGLLGLGPAAPTQVAGGKHSWRAVTPHLGVKYRFNDAVNVYANYNAGFKSGAFNGTGLSNTPVDPEKIDAYEAGLKAQFDRVRLGAAIYHYSYRDLQVAATVTRSNGTTASVLQNAASAKIDGIDMDGELRIAEGLTVSAGLAYTDATFRRFANATVNTPAAACSPAPYPCGNVSTVIDATGFRIPRAPKFTGSFTATYDAALAAGHLIASSTLYYNSGFSWEVGNRVRQDAYSTLGANLLWRPDDQHWEVSVWGRNLQNKTYSMQESDSPGGDAVAYAQPRSYGVQFRYSF